MAIFVKRQAYTRAISLQSFRVVWRLCQRQPLGILSGVYLVLVGLVALAAPLLAPYDPEALVSRRLVPPNSQFWFGTDELGRDVLSRIIYGARISLGVGLGAVMLSTLLGSILGIISGYFLGWLDMLIQRAIDALMSFPALVLVLALVAALGRSPANVAVAIALVAVPLTTRVVRSAVLSVAVLPYVEAACTIGAGTARILLRHILPNVLVPILVISTLGLGSAILTEAALSFLSLGVPPPTPSWGSMINGSSRLYVQQAPWIALFPGLALSSVVLAINLLGDAARDVLDPRLRS